MSLHFLGVLTLVSYWPVWYNRSSPHVINTILGHDAQFWIFWRESFGARGSITTPFDEPEMQVTIAFYPPVKHIISIGNQTVSSSIWNCTSEFFKKLKLHEPLRFQKIPNRTRRAVWLLINNTNMKNIRVDMLYMISLAYKFFHCLSANHNPELRCVICTGARLFVPVLHFLHCSQPIRVE